MNTKIAKEEEERFAEVVRSVAAYMQVLPYFYKNLIENGVPYDLARELTIIWHEIYWDHFFAKDKRDNEQL